MEYGYRINQEQLRYLYESAKSRMEAHPEYTEKQREIIKNCSIYESERDALEAAIKLPEGDMECCIIWAKIEKVEEFYRIKNDYWLVTYTGDAIKAAEYLGMADMYNSERIQDIIRNNAKID